MVKAWIPFLFATLLSFSVQGQSIFDTFGTGRGSSVGGTRSGQDLFTETIDRISISRRIFILTNRNNAYGKGDFITLILENQPIARAIVAKTTERQLSGIKVVTIYNMALWNELRVGMQLQILRGDDTAFRNQQTQQESSRTAGIIQDESDLFNDTTFLEDDLRLDDNQNRALRNDHLASVSYTLVEGLNNDFSSQRYGQPTFTYAYQIADNIFLEASIGQNLINDFPALGLDARLTNLVGRIKYTFAGPYFTFFQPYVGYQSLTASSKDAGVPDGIATPEQLQRELDLLDESSKNTIVFGVTALRRLVPGWFLRVDLGSDSIAGGLSLEF
jgi:hypothetical protein